MALIEQKTDPVPIQPAMSIQTATERAAELQRHNELQQTIQRDQARKLILAAQRTQSDRWSWVSELVPYAVAGAAVYVLYSVVKGRRNDNRIVNGDKSRGRAARRGTNSPGRGG